MFKKSNKGISLSLLLCLIFSINVFAKPSIVKIEGTNGTFRLIRNEQPYFIEGAGGGASKKLLSELGGNSFRTWGSDQAKKELDEAEKNGLTVMIGFWLGHAGHGFNYTDEESLNRTTEAILKTVREQKDHPALLCWALGNEMELSNPHVETMWKYINELAGLVKEIDGNHPVCTVIAEIPEEKVRQIEKLCPNIDFVGINTYGGSGSIAERWRSSGGTKPYVITEFGPPGPGETGRSSFGVPLEMSSTEKAAWYKQVYGQTILKDKDKLCLGSYAFIWGWKVEATPTWFGMLLPDKSILGSAQAMQELWGHSEVTNRCPEIITFNLENDDLINNSEIVEASCLAEDPDGDELTWKWVLISDNVTYGDTGLGLPMPESFEDAIIDGQGTNKVKVKFPGGSKYRLYAYCFDGNGNAAYANRPVRVQGTAFKIKLPEESVPFPVYTNGTFNVWFPSGYIGNAGALSLDGHFKLESGSENKCISVSYTDSNGWAGVFWQNPPNDWGEHPGGRNLTKAKKLVFSARGKEGGEKVVFFMGGITGKPYSDSDKAGLEIITLSKDWTLYTIPLEDLDLTHIKTAFGFTLAAENKPIVFYLDNINFMP